MARILYVGGFLFPNGNAAAARVLGIGKALREAGHEVLFAGGEDKERREDLCEDGVYRYQGFPYVSLGVVGPVKPRSFRQRAVRFLRYGRSTRAYLKLLHPRPDVVVTYHGLPHSFALLRRCCARRNISLVFDCTEWADVSQTGALSPAYWATEWMQRVSAPRIGNVIAISRYLERYFQSRRCRTLWAPPLVDFDDPKWAIPTPVRSQKGESPDGPCFVYAGRPGRKDLIGNALRALPRLQAQGCPARIEIVGMTAEQTRELLDDDVLFGKVRGMIRCHGRISQEEVPSILAKCDASILLRDDNRTAQAGFSTKLVESLAAGLPVITNRTGDIPEFVRDRVEGILLDGPTPEDFACGVQRWCRLSTAQKRDMRNAARRRALESFDYRNYVESIGNFVDECLASRDEKHGRR